jgi:hypothetical protein
MSAQLRDLGRTLPDLWARGQFTPAPEKEMVRSLIRRVIVTRPVPDIVEAKVVWVSGAVTPLQVHPPMLRQADVRGYEHFVERVLALGAAGYQDHGIAWRLTEEGFRSARRTRVPVTLLGEIRRARGQISLTEPCKSQAKLEGQWTVFGLAQELRVHRHWLSTRIRNGTLAATRHPVIGHYLIPDAPPLMTTLRAQRDRCCYREEGIFMAWPTPICNIF